METSAAEEFVGVLLDYQFDMLYVRTSPWGMNHVEFLFNEAAEVIEAHDGLRAWVIELFEGSILSGCDIWRGEPTRPESLVPSDFMLYFIHRTRWPEFGLLANRVEGSPEDLWQSNRLTRWSQAIREAMSDEWRDREFFRRFAADA